ncbi:PIR protein [Plasmodium ovale]|uniref:PIR Superfamily Protein n=2 Tax=Plasmodium ovale TaxID=36330 RepID=A0A1A8WJS9_PLAOA|nr:PIR Superfamily Protein [Plasmodium ovale curtisi]SBT84220.1 PIR protein [Plasmodium ovale]
MSDVQDKFTYENFKNDNIFFEGLIFDKIYKKFNGEYIEDSTAIQKCQEIKSSLLNPYQYEELILNFCKILYKIIAKSKGWQNDITDEIPKDDKLLCTSLKYWLYEKIVNNDIKGLGVDEHFQKWKVALEGKINGQLSIPCTFNKLNWIDIDKIRSIYAFLLIYYSNVVRIYNNKPIKCKYSNFFGKGLKAYYESLSVCSVEKEDDNYCKEFNEFQQLHKLYNIYWKKSTFNTEYNYSEESNDECPLNIESPNDPLIVSYKEKNNILYLSNQTIDYLKNSIISSSSAIGATVGISAFLFYIYKYTSLGSIFPIRMQKDNTIFENTAEGTNGFTVSTSEIEPIYFKNSDYKMSYYSLNNS